MPLQKQNFSVSFAQGADTKSDPKQVVPGKLLLLENGVFTSTKRIRKRSGKDELSRVILNPPTSATSISVGQDLSTFQDELLMADVNNFYSYAEAGQNWVNKGAFVSAYLSSTSVIRNSYKQTQQDSTTHPLGVSAFAWEDSSGGSRYSLFDAATGQSLVSNALILSTAIKPKLLSLGNNIILLYVNTSDSRVYGALIAPGSPTAALAPVALTATAGTSQLNAVSPNYDACISGAQLFIAFNTAQGGGGTTIFASYLADPLTISNSVNVAGQVSTVLTVFFNGFSGGPVLSYWNGTDVKYRAYTSSLGTLLGSGTLETIANIAFITGASVSSSVLALTFFYSQTAASTYNYLTRTNSVTGAYVIGTAGAFLRSVSIAGKAFTYQTNAYVPLVYESPLQPTYFIARSNGALVAKMLASLSGGIPVRALLGSAMLPESNLLSDGVSRQFAFLVKDLLTTDAGAIYTLTGVQSITLDFFDPVHSYGKAEIGNNLHLSGGFLQMYDGAAPVEHGFHLFPEPVSVPNPGTAFTYQYVVCYEWSDAQGQIHRSAPSIPVTQGQALAIDGGHSVAITIPTLRLTSKQVRSPVVCVTYRTVNNGTVFYQVGSISSPTLNSVTADTVTLTDTLTDAALIGNPLLYTTGGVLENIAPPSFAAMVVHRNRIFGIDAENRLRVRYSKQVIPGLPAEFSDFLELNIDPVGGEATALGSLDDKLIVFKTNSIGAITGQGPDATGGQNDFSDFLPVTSDVGCINPRSVVQSPVGLMFDTTKGKYLLDRGLSSVYVGRDMETYNGQTVTSSQLIPGANQVRFTLDTGVDLVYDYLEQQWSVSTIAGAVDSVIQNNLFHALSSGGVVSRETPGRFVDGQDFIKLRLKTSWLQLADIQGFQRIYKILVLGEYASPHRLQVSLAYDFDPTPRQVDIIAPSQPGAYGVDSPYGVGTPYGGDFPLYQWRIFPAIQKCSAIQITIEDIGTTDFGEAFSISAVSLELGVKKGLKKMPATASFG